MVNLCPFRTWRQYCAIRSDVPLEVLIRMNTEYEVWLLKEMQEERLNEQQAVDKFFEMFKLLFEENGERYGKNLVEIEGMKRYDMVSARLRRSMGSISSQKENELSF